MDNRSKLFFAFGAGALLGAAAIALFTTDKGKELIEKTKSQMADLSEEVKEKIKDLEDEIADLLKGDEPGEAAGPGVS